MKLTVNVMFEYLLQVCVCCLRPGDFILPPTVRMDEFDRETAKVMHLQDT